MSSVGLGDGKRESSFFPGRLGVFRRERGVVPLNRTPERWRGVVARDGFRGFGIREARVGRVGIFFHEETRKRGVGISQNKNPILKEKKPHKISRCNLGAKNCKISHFPQLPPTIFVIGFMVK